MIVRVLVFMVLAALSHVLFGWEIVWGEQSVHIFNFADIAMQEDLDFFASQYHVGCRINHSVFGLMRPIPLLMEEPPIHSTVLAWVMLYLTFAIPVQMHVPEWDEMEDSHG
jgi:hypothetical protein